MLPLSARPIGMDHYRWPRRCDAVSVRVLGEGQRTGAVPQWSGREVRALREARRMSVREFAAHLGVSDRMVSKWEAGGIAIRPRPINQAALDTSLAQSSDAVRTRFAAIFEGRSHQAARQRVECATAPITQLVRHPEDGKLMTLVEAGPFRCGRDGRPVWAAGFYMDIYPTTNADYGRFLAATGHPAPGYWGGDEPPVDRLSHPVVQVSWVDAGAYAAWAAKALPTSVEWEKAARGELGSTYPWGEHAGAARANVAEARINDTTPVDRYENGVSPYGIYDLCGNVWEWCDGGARPGCRELRGGAHTAPLNRSAPALSEAVPELLVRPDVGFRCVTPVAALLELLSI
jgi:formylglycine-generating enzyme required for sulfatase activity